uniref:Uncharacterized protein n=1 Tax=Anguilla anguilla TaxID=7936 RepID=A0A0E9R3Y5_ANGAN
MVSQFCMYSSLREDTEITLQ